MGQTRVKKAKKPSKQRDNAPMPIIEKMHDLSLDEDSKTTITMSQSAKSTSSEGTRTPQPSSLSEDNFVSDPNLLELRSTPDKGVAVFAARKIPAGTLVLSEHPLIRLTQHEEDTADADKSSEPCVLTNQFLALPKQIQKSYLTLFDSRKSDYSRVKSIYYSNCYNLSLSSTIVPSPKSSPGGSCIGMLASRLNHSCIPNVQFSFDEARNLMLFHAIKPIPRGREVTSNYDSVFELRAQRHRRQTLYYGFRCDCEACESGSSEFWARSDERRAAMLGARKEVRECEKVWNDEAKLRFGLDPVAALVKLEGLLVKEGLLGVVLADVCSTLVKWCERLGDLKNVDKWRRKELEVSTVCLGAGSVRVANIRTMIEVEGMK